MKLLCINKVKMVTISASPVQPQHKLYNIQRPNKFYGEDLTGDPGTKHLLDRLVLREFDKCMLNNNFHGFPKTLIFVKKIEEGIKINQLLTYRYKNVPARNRPWMLYHSETKNITQDQFQKKCDAGSLKIIISTPKVLMGVNLPTFRKVIMLGPYTFLSDLSQAVGRTGRREEGGRARSILYNCYNNTDLAFHTSNDVINFCKTDGCLKAFQHKYFTNEDKVFGGEWCCNKCSN